MRDDNDFEAPKPIAETLVYWNRAFRICLEFVFSEISIKNPFLCFINTIKKKVYTKVF